MDITQENAQKVLDLTGALPSSGYDNPLNIDNQVEELAKQREKIANASFGDKVSAGLEQAKKSNTIHDLFQLSLENSYSKFQKDDEFLKTFNSDSIDLLLEENKLPLEDGSYLAKSKSKKELHYRLLDKIAQKTADEQIRNTLTENEMIGSSIVGAVVDAPTVLGLGIGSMYGVGSSIAKITMIEGAFNSALALEQYMTHDDISMRQAIAFAGVGTALSVGATRLAQTFHNSRIKSEIIDDSLAEQASKDIKTPLLEYKPQALLEYKQDPIIVSYSEEFAQSRKSELIKWYHSSGKRIDEINNEINSIDSTLAKQEELYASGQIPKPSDEYVLSLNNKKQALMEEGKTIENELKTTRGVEARQQAEIEDVLTQERLRAEEERLFAQQRNEQLAKQFESERYATYSENRKSFFNLQNEIHGHILENKLSIINATINTIKNKITDLHKKLETAGSKAVKTRYKNSINSLTKELETQKENLSVNLSKKPLSPEKERMLRTVDEMAEDIHNVVDELHGIVKSASKEELAELEEIVTVMKQKYPKEMEQVYSLLKSKINNKTVEELVKMGKLPKALTLASVLAVSGFAGQGGEDNKAEIVGAMFLVAGGIIAFKNPQMFKAITNPNIRQSIANVGSKLSKAYQSATFKMSPEAGIIRRVGTFFAQTGHTRLTSAIAPFKKEGGAIHEIANKLMYSFTSQDGAEISKRMWNEGDMALFNGAEKKFFKLWKSEKGTSYFNTFFDDTVSILNFRKEVANAMKNRNGQYSESIKGAIEEYDKIFEKLYARNKQYGTYGFEKLDYKKGLLPRYWKNAYMQNIIPLLSDADVLKVRDMLKNAFAKKSGDFAEAEKQADVFIGNWKNDGHKYKIRSSTEDIYGVLQQHFKDDVEFEDVANSLNTYSDRQARSKYRIDFDENDLSKGVIVNVNGADTRIGLEELIETDIKTIMDKTMNQLNAHASLSRHGYKSVAELDRAIANLSNIKDKSLVKELHQVKDLILGVPVENASTHLHDFMMAVKDLTIGFKLPFVVMSMGSEMFNLLSSSSLNITLKALAESIAVSMGKESELMSQLSRVSGLANNIVNNDLTFRGLTEGFDSLEDAALIHGFRTGTIAFKKAMLYVNGLFGMTDIIQRAGTAINLQRIGKAVVLGDTSKNGISKMRMKMTGISDEKISQIKDVFKFDDKGNLKPIEWSKLSMEQEDTIGEMLRALNQEISPETTLGETPLWAYTESIGKAFSTLSLYPVQQFNIQGLGGMYAMDRVALMQSFGAFAGSYLGLHARYSLQNKKVDDEKILMYSIMSMPQIGALSFINSMINPPVLDTVSSVTALVGADRRR